MTFGAGYPGPGRGARTLAPEPWRPNPGARTPAD